MARTEPFEAHPERYDAWFERHDAACVSELLALRPFVPLAGRGPEIGVGSGRFAAPLGVQVGIDPSPTLLERACAGYRGARGRRRTPALCRGQLRSRADRHDAALRRCARADAGAGAARAQAGRRAGAWVHRPRERPGPPPRKPARGQRVLPRRGLSLRARGRAAAARSRLFGVLVGADAVRVAAGQRRHRTGAPGAGAVRFRRRPRRQRQGPRAERGGPGWRVAAAAYSLARRCLALQTRAHGFAVARRKADAAGGAAKLPASGECPARGAAEGAGRGPERAGKED